MLYLKLLTQIGLRRLASSFISIFGLLWLLIEPGALFFPQYLNLGLAGYLGLVVVSLVIAIIQRSPRTAVCKALSSPDSVVEIKIGELFDEPGHLVIGANDVFDTQLGEVIKPSSVQGQFLTRVYGNDRSRLDADPVIGSDLARTNLLRMTLAKLIIMSFIVASKKDFVSRKLTLVIYPRDLENTDFYDLEDFLTSACF